MGDENKSFGGVFDFLGGLVDTGVQVWQNEEQREWASKEAQHNRDFQEHMYERNLDDSIAWRTHQEQYNSPEAMMQRYRDAGINPMYVVNGAAGGSSVTTPMQANGSGYGSSVPSPNQHRLSFAEAFRMRNEARLTDANVKLIESEAREHNAVAQLREDQLPESGFYRDVWNQFVKIRFTDEGTTGDDGGLSWHNAAYDRAQFMAAAQEYAWKYQDLEYKEAKAKFEHSQAVRQFEISLNDHKRAQFKYELSHASSAAEMFRVSAKWAVANQWINAGSTLLGAATGFTRTLKAPASMDTYIYGSNERHIYGDYNYKPAH